MKPVYQKIVNKDTGDCFRACVASILELECDEVPNFRALENETGVHMMKLAQDWLAENYGLSLVQIYMHKLPECSEEFRLVGGSEGTPVIASVDSPNLEGCTHAVVGQIDKHGLNISIIHDPNQNGKPITSYPQFISMLVPLKPERFTK